MKKLYSGRLVPTTIDTTQRIFQVTTYDGDIFLCNISAAESEKSQGHTTLTDALDYMIQECNVPERDIIIL